MLQSYRGQMAPHYVIHWTLGWMRWNTFSKSTKDMDLMNKLTQTHLQPIEIIELGHSSTTKTEIALVFLNLSEVQLLAESSLQYTGGLYKGG